MIKKSKSTIVLIGKGKEQSHCGECGKTGCIVRTYCFVCNTHCENNNASLCLPFLNKTIRKQMRNVTDQTEIEFNLTPLEWRE